MNSYGTVLGTAQVWTDFEEIPFQGVGRYLQWHGHFFVDVVKGKKVDTPKDYDATKAHPSIVRYAYGQMYFGEFFEPCLSDWAKYCKEKNVVNFRFVGIKGLYCDAIAINEECNDVFSVRFYGPCAESMANNFHLEVLDLETLYNPEYLKLADYRVQWVEKPEKMCACYWCRKHF
jgi:hypothetical protein